MDESQTKETILAKPSSFKDSKLPKFLLGLIGFLLVIIVAEGIFYFLNLKKAVREKALEKPALPTLLPQEGKENNLEIAKKTLVWLDQQRDERGVYTFGYKCSADGKCEKPVVDDRAGLAVIWGRYKYYQQTKDEQELVMLDKDLNLYSDPEKVPTIQNNFWNCRMMYELWQSSLFSESQKEKIREICLRGVYYPPELQEVNDKIKRGEIEEPDLSKIIQGEAFQGSLSVKEEKLVEYSSYASDFIAKYFWQKDEDDLKRGKLYFNKALKAYGTGSDVPQEGRCLLGLASLDLYEVMPEGKFLGGKFFDFASFLFQRAEKEACQNLFSCSSCAIFAKELHNLVKEERYKTYQKNILLSLIRRGFDSKEGCFRSLGGGDIIKPVRENGLAVGVLSENDGL